MELLSEASLKIIFNEMDVSKDEAIREHELLVYFERIDKSITAETIHELLKEADLDINGMIDFKGSIYITHVCVFFKKKNFWIRVFRNCLFSVIITITFF